MKQRAMAVLTALTGVVAATGVAGVGPASADDEAVPVVGWVVGRVVDDGGRPVAGALVNVLSPREVPEPGIVDDVTDRRASTGADGRFRVRQHLGGYLVQVCQPDPERPTTCLETAQGVKFVITYAGGAGVTDSWVLQQRLIPGGPGTHDVGVVEVGRPGRVHGRIADAPQGTEVRLMRGNDTVAFRTWVDDRGRYELPGLVPGRYRIATGGAGHLPWTSEPVSVEAGVSTRVDGVLDRGAAIVGTLTSAGKPVTGVDVWVRRAGHGILAIATSDRAGKFRVSGLVPDRYDLRVRQGSGYVPTATRIEVTGVDQTVRSTLTLDRGATIRLRVRAGGEEHGRVRDELRNGSGRTIQIYGNDGSGRITYRGLPPGRYTTVVADTSGYVSRTVRVEAGQVARLGTVAPSKPLTTLTGRTAPNAIVEATTGDFCPPDGTYRYGAIHEIVSADAQGRYAVPGLIPGRYMLGSDDWPRTHAPRCVSDVRVRAGSTADLPLQPGGTATGRLVYAGTTDPVITPLSYELTYPHGRATNPTLEHPARARTLRATGRFTIRRLAPGELTGRLASEAAEGINHPSFFVTFPFQDGTPYWLDTATATVDVPLGGDVRLGDIEVVTHGRH